MPYPTITKQCLFCNNQFETRLSEHKRGNAKYCSRSCSTKAMHHNTIRPPHPLNCNCSECGKQFYKPKSKLGNSKSGLYFCSRICKDKAQRIGGIEAIMPDHYGLGNGEFSYRELAFSNLPHVCCICNYSTYPETLIVHHKDRNRHNNILENLCVLCPTCHTTIHFFLRKGIKHLLPAFHAKAIEHKLIPLEHVGNDPTAS